MGLFFFSAASLVLLLISNSVSAVEAAPRGSAGTAATSRSPATAPPAAPQCPDWVSANRQGAPECPASGLVPETYPIGAIVVSDLGYRTAATRFEDGGRDSNFTADVVIAALEGAGDRLPVIILPVAPETMTVINNRIDSLSIPESRKTLYRQALRHAPQQDFGYTWQQDYMQSFVNPATGQPMFREVQGYSANRGDNFFNSALTDQFRQCGIQTGPQLETTGAFRGGFMGGNIEALPGGICMVGDDYLSEAQYNAYIQQVCPGSTPQTRVKAPTSWLSVGHTDEVIKTIRNSEKAPPCDFSIVVASPRKAIELLQQNPNEPFLNFEGGRGGTARELAQRRVLQYPGLSQLCFEIRAPDAVSPTPTSPAPAPSPGQGRGVSLHPGIQILLFGSVVYAEEVTLDTEDFCTSMTNGEVARLLSGNGDLARYNRLIQTQMDNLKADVRQKVSAAIPGCQPDFIDAPDAFFGGAPVRKEDGSYELPRRQALSILPNPTNAISVNNTLISPEPGNTIFKNYLSEQYRNRGLNPRFVDTFDYAHMGQGNLHCSTNTVHLCSPRGSR